MNILLHEIILLACIISLTSGYLTVPVNRLDRTLTLREDVGDHYWPSSLPSKYRDDVTASVCVGQSLIARYSREQWSMQMWDASGTSLVGTKAGAHQARGHQELCTKVHKELSGTIFQELDSLIHRPVHLSDALEKLNPLAMNVTPPPVQGRYCVISIRSKNDAILFSSGSSELLASLSNHNTPNYATCVPDTCSEDLLQVWLQRLEGKGSVVQVKCTTSYTIFNKGSNNYPSLLHPELRETSDVRFNLTTNLNSSVDLFLQLESKPITRGTILFGIFAVFVLLLTLSSTFVDVYLQSDKPNHSSGSQYSDNQNVNHQIRESSNSIQNMYIQQNLIYGWDILQCFSIQRNWQRIFPTKRSSSEIPVIDGLRCVCMFWVIIAHRFMLMLVTSSYPDDLLQNRNNPNYWWLFNSYPSVDVFFVISGFLLSVAPMHKVSLKFLLTNYIYRYLRLCPSVMVTVWGVYSVLGHLGSGPIWDTLYYGFFGRTCEISWLSSVMLMANINHPNDMCLGHLWSLSVDWQLYVVGLLVIMPLYCEGSRSRRYLPLIIVTLASLIIPGIITVTYSLPVLPTMASVKKSLDFYNYYYVNTLCRASPYFVGVIGGRAHVYFKENPEYLCKKYVRIGRAISVFVLSGVMIGPMCISKNDVFISTLHNTVAKPCFAIAVIFLIITSYHGKGGLLGWVLSRSFVGLLARCSYCIYLTSLPIQVWSAATDSTLPSQGIIQIYACCGDILLSIIGGITMTLLIELPAAQLLNYSLRSKKERSKKEKSPSKLIEISRSENTITKNEEDSSLSISSESKSEIKRRNPSFIEPFN